ncbi:MAG: VOC family protein [Gammaproteobacteria bacterium]|nr:VOC family protein [Gammaproteobacteria bacterium]
MRELRSWRALALAATLLAATSAVWAGPVPADERIPVDVRRTTLIVRDVDKALAFYRDALGLKLVYDQAITRPGRPEDPPGTQRRMRLALLRANDSFVGVIGLLEYTSPRLPDPPNEAKRPGIGQVILVINASDLDQRFERVRSTPGVRVASEPQLTEYPSPDGKGTIPVRVSAVWDPDGYFIELNQLLGQAAGTAGDASKDTRKE